MNRQLLRTQETTTMLNGKKYRYTYSSGMGVELNIAESDLVYKIVEGPYKGEEGKVNYSAREISEGIYLIQWHEEEANITVSIVINEIAGSVSSSEAHPDMRVFDTGLISEMN